nr:immunoglobulin light chain junction region [Macaca mulatta]
CLQHKDYPPTF